MKTKLNLLFDDAVKVTVKLATTRSELEAAYSLLYEVYLSEGYTELNAHRMRVTLFNALPTTTTLVALVDGRVVGTLTSVRDSAIGLPSDPITNLGAVRREHRCISEVSGLAIHPDFRGHHGRVLFPLIKFIHLYEEKYHGVDAFVIAVNPKHAPFWEQVVGFEPICSEVTPSSFAGGAPAVIKIQDLKTYRQRLDAMYTDIPFKSNFPAYMLREEPNFEFPRRIYPQAFDTAMSPENLKYFFLERTDVLKHLSEAEQMIVSSQYLLPDYRPLFQPRRITGRKAQRFAVQIEGRLLGSSSIGKILMTEMSLSGVGLFTDLPIEHEAFKVKISWGDLRNIRLVVKPVWRSERNYVGCKIIEAPQIWSMMIENLSQQLRGPAQETGSRLRA